MGQQHGCILAGQDPPALQQPPTRGAGQHPQPRDWRSPLENGGKNKSSSGERWGRLSRRDPWHSWAGRVAAPWAERPCTQQGCSALFCPAAPWHLGDQGCRGCPAAPRGLEGPSSHSLVALGDLEGKESDGGRWHRADGIIRNMERGWEVTWGSWWATVPHQPHALLPFLSFGTRLPWRRDVNGQTPIAADTPALGDMGGSTYPACLAHPAAPLCQSALASLGILGVPAGQAAHPCLGDLVCLGLPPSPPGSASVRCSMPCALWGQAAQRGLRGTGGAPALAPITPVTIKHLANLLLDEPFDLIVIHHVTLEEIRKRHGC